MSKPTTPNDLNDQEMTLVQHLLELRDRMTRAVLAVLILFLICFVFANDLYTYLALPLTEHLTPDTSMIATAVASPFLTPMRLSLYVALFIAMPYILYQLWAFIAPGLYQNEKKFALPLIASSVVLFYLGGIFAYYVVFPLVFGFLTSTGPDGVTIATDITLYLDFVIKMFFAFGLAFEVPVATFILILAGMVKPDSLAQKRPYIILAAFVIGMLLTPPDVISQTLLAIPMWLLFELGLLTGRLVLRRRADTQSNDNPNDNQPEPEPESGSSSTATTPHNTTSATTMTATGSTMAANNQWDDAPFDDRYQQNDTTRATDNEYHDEYDDEYDPYAIEDDENVRQTPRQKASDNDHLRHKDDIKNKEEDDDDDDFDFDDEFDRIDAEFAKLNQNTAQDRPTDEDAPSPSISSEKTDEHNEPTKTKT